MSSTNRGAKRDARDFYPTPAWCVGCLLEAVELPGGTWLEPAAGRGAIVDAVRARRGEVTWKLVEAHPEPEDRAAYKRLGVRVRDVHTKSFFDVGLDDLGGPIDVVITNPPFARAMEFVERAMDLGPKTIVMLLRLDFLGSQTRAPFMRLYAPDVYVLPRRPSFVGRGADSNEYAFGATDPTAPWSTPDDFDAAEDVSEYATTQAKEDLEETFMVYLRDRRSLSKYRRRPGVFAKPKAVEAAVTEVAANRVPSARRRP